MTKSIKVSKGEANDAPTEKVFFEILKKEFAPRLRELGFKGSGRNYRRNINGILQCINLMKDRRGQAYRINLGIHFDFYPVGDHVRFETIKEINCCIRWILGPDLDDPLYYWAVNREGPDDGVFWAYYDTPTESARALISTFFNEAMPLFATYSTVSAFIKFWTNDRLTDSNGMRFPDPRQYANQQRVHGAEMSFILAHYYFENNDLSKAKEMIKLSYSSVGKWEYHRSRLDKFCKEKAMQID